jgi:hypothetical protein
MGSIVTRVRGIVLWAVGLAALALVAGAGPAQEPVADQAPDGSAALDAAAEASRRADVLASSRWRRAMHELDEWLAGQPVYPPQRVRQIKAEFAERVATMSSYELEYLLDQIDEKIEVLDSPAAREAREWVGRYLAVMADERRAALVATVPNVLDMSAAELAATLADVVGKRTRVERSHTDSQRARRRFGDFGRADRQAISAERARISRIHRDDAAFSPYRGQPVEDPPFATAFDSPTVVGVGPWNAFCARSLTAF